jgi:nucleoside-diphosphate-sugar epimerase
MNKNSVHSSADMFLYKAIVDFNSAQYLLAAYNEDKIEIDIEEFKPLIIERLMPLKPDGTMKKLTDVSKLHALGWKHKVGLKEGVKTMYEWFKNR